MKLLRIWLLVLLAVLLPVRGAMAASMLCPPAGGESRTEARLMASSHHRHGDGTHKHHEPAHDDKCNLCSASCSLTPMPSHVAGIAEPRHLAGISYPPLSAPAPSFVSDGQERPPRSI
ncbi:MAG: DUF2946 family protein [Rubrivivax sp.]